MELILEIFCKCGEPLQIVQLEDKKAFVESCGNCKMDGYREGYGDGWSEANSERDERDFG